MTTDTTKPLAKFSWSLNSNTGLSSSGSQNDITPEMYGAIMGVLAGRFPEAEIARLQSQVDALRHERDRARASTDNAAKLLVSIHSLLYPAPTTLADGRTMVFRPKSPDPHEVVLQELSDRIRALPDELAALAAAGR